MNFLEYSLNSTVSFTEKELQDISSRFKKQIIPAGRFVLLPGEVCRDFYFIVKGSIQVITRAHPESVVWTGHGGNFLTSISSFSFETPNEWAACSSEETDVMVLSKEDHIELSKKYPRWVRFYQLYTARAFSALERRFMN